MRGPRRCAGESSPLVSLRHIDEMRVDSGHWSVRIGDDVLQVSRRHSRELRDMLGAAGFTDVRFHGDYDGAPYDHRAERLIAVATKGVDVRGN